MGDKEHGLLYGAVGTGEGKAEIQKFRLLLSGCLTRQRWRRLREATLCSL